MLEVGNTLRLWTHLMIAPLAAALCALVAHKQNVAKQVHGAYSHDPVNVVPPQIRSVENYAYLSSLS